MNVDRQNRLPGVPDNDQICEQRGRTSGDQEVAEMCRGAEVNFGRGGTKSVGEEGRCRQRYTKVEADKRQEADKEP